MKPRTMFLGLVWLAAPVWAGTITTNVAPSGTIIDTSGSYSTTFDAINTLDGQTEEGTNSPVSYWLAPDGVTNAYFILDLRRDYAIKTIALFNTHNRQYNDRGTALFQLLSGDGVEPNPLSPKVSRYYPFDGDLKDGSTNKIDATMLDSTGAAFTPSFLNDVAAAVKTGQSLSFSGGGEYVQAIDPIQPTAYTISLWVKIETIQSCSLVLRTAGDPTKTWSHQIRLSPDGVFQHYIWDGAEKTVTGTTVTQPDTWYHVAATAENNGAMHLYVNGTEEGTSVQLGTMWQGGNQWVFGTGWGSGGSAFAGQLDEVAFWLSAPLTSSLIKTLSQGTKPTAVDNPAAASQGLRLINPRLILSGALSDVTAQDQIQPNVFTPTNGLSAVTTRYLQFRTLTSIYSPTNNNVGLNEIQVMADVDTTPPVLSYGPAVLISWPYNLWVSLQSRTNLSSASWTVVPAQPAVIGTNLAVFQAATNRGTFYQLGPARSNP